MTQQEIHELNFRNTEELILYHKYLYYELSKQIITDQHFDGMDAYARKLSKHVDLIRFPPEEYVHGTMVGFDDSHPYWPSVVERFRINYKKSTK